MTCTQKKDLFVRWVAVLLLGYGLFQSGSIASAQEELANTVGKLYRDQRNILQELASAPWVAKEKQEGVKTYVCPKDGREFQLIVSSRDLENQKGMKSIYCPYDGFQFYPSSTNAEEPSQLSITTTNQVRHGEFYTMRSPVDGKEFKAAVDVQNLLSGNAIFTSPFDGTQFRFTPQTLDYTDQGQIKQGMITLISPATGKKFRTIVTDQNQLLTDPYTGRKMPAFQFSVASDERKDRDSASLKSSLRSRIEAMFSGGNANPVNDEEVEQFGYSIFPTEEEVLQWKEQERIARQQGAVNFGASAASSGGGNNGGAMGIMGRMGQNAGASQNNYFASGGYSSVLINKDYILGPGDVLIVYLWGKMQQTFPLAIDAEGTIFLPEVGPVQLTGITFSQAEEIIRQKLEEHFTNFKISVSMGRLRLIPVFVFGEVKTPGAHMVSAQSTVMQVLFTAGGPTKMGTLRGIELMREKEKFLIDLYQILISGEKSVDIQVRENDVIMVPPIGDVVAVKGSVKRPAIYELTSTIALSQLIEIAGGLSAKGYAHRLRLERVVDHEKMVVEDLEFENTEDLRNRTKQIEIREGDTVNIFPIAPIRYQYVSIEGNVLYPGDYEWREGMDIKELLEKAGGFAPRTYLSRADLIRGTNKGFQEIPINLSKLIQGDPAPNMTLQQWDRLRVYDLEAVTPTQFVEIQGPAQRPGPYPLTVGMRISDLLFKAGGLEPRGDLETAELFRSVPEKGIELINVNLGEVLKNKGSDQDLPLQENDQLFVRVVPEYWQQIKVKVSGEVVYPGEYVVQKGERLSSLLERTGGLTQYAYPEGAVFRRVSIQLMQQELFQKFLKTEQGTVLQEQSSLGMGFPVGQAEARTKLVEFQEKQLNETKQGGIFTGRLMIHLKSLEPLKGSDDDVILQQGDSLFIPAVPSYVLVVNNLQQVMAVTYEEGKGVEYYLKKVGGLQKYDDGRAIYVITPAGELISRFVKTMPIHRGDTIVIPQKIQYKTPTGLLVKDTISTLYQIGLGAIAVASINN